MVNNIPPKNEHMGGQRRSFVVTNTKLIHIKKHAALLRNLEATHVTSPCNHGEHAARILWPFPASFGATNKFT